MSLFELSCTAKNSNNANKETDKKILPELGSPPQPGAPAGMVPGWDKLYQYICTYKYKYILYVDILSHISTHMFYNHWLSNATCALTTATSSSSMRPTLRRRPLFDQEMITWPYVQHKYQLWYPIHYDHHYVMPCRALGSLLPQHPKWGKSHWMPKRNLPHPISAFTFHGKGMGG